MTATKHPPDAPKPTKFEQYLRDNDIRPSQLARESGYSPKHLRCIRLGEIEPTRRCVAAVVSACRRLSRTHVSASDLFDFTPEP